MVLFPNALSISFTATLSNLHHRLLSSVPASLLPPPLVMSCLGFSHCFLPPFYFYPCNKAWSLTSCLLFQPCILCSLPPISLLYPFPSLPLFTHISSTFSHPFSSFHLTVPCKNALSPMCLCFLLCSLRFLLSLIPLGGWALKPALKPTTQ